ncbi:monocarboxylate transporter 12 [Caerostris extrusa]|uniref:Monocarboxylate transporter 12 n=1 Tax=Caerostris extrusa TaxID=172846 RepID=A0AAV4XJB7_CAEEX|nr:monocarboxylate transporter 12 [Caerostris extrusa]
MVVRATALNADRVVVHVCEPSAHAPGGVGGRRKSPACSPSWAGWWWRWAASSPPSPSQLHQLHFSCGAVLGVGLGLTRSTATLMLGQYFKKRRELAEVFLLAGSCTGRRWCHS